MIGNSSFLRGFQAISIFFLFINEFLLICAYFLDKMGKVKDEQVREVESDAVVQMYTEM